MKAVIAALVVSAMPVLLSFAAGAMLYVVGTAFLCRKMPDALHSVPEYGILMYSEVLANDDNL